MSKATHRSLLALTLIALLPGCSKEGSGTTDTADAAAQAPAATEQSAEPHPIPSASAGADVDLSGITKAEGGKTVAELYAEKDALANQKITVRGKVVKANSGIMNMDWVHVRDGSGADGTNDLTVTTTSTPLPNVGDTVIVTGTVALNKDFGMGYQYPVILENSQVKIEASAP